ncbi:metal ABC transporter substrate-binding protein [Proteocatella sphenisci]|uniref:metal ABC transporter substrate-binding protein n=1 Tax=Proteocatella sphenisci TaxID=181070 RepID=UPI00048FBC60|nr:metal ABC transporter substrate-binding protein [Proteocatella sphenisci]
MKKRILMIILASVLGLTACSSETLESQTENNEGKFKIVSTVFPGYDFAKNIAGENAQISLLLPPGSESHSYEPSPQDIIKIQNADLFIYVGGESEDWVSRILDTMETKVKTLSMMEVVEVYEEETVEGMQHDHDESDHDESGHDEVAYDEHVWTSPVNAIKISRAISDMLVETDPENAQLYSENAEVYIQKLDKLDKDFKEFFDTVDNKLLIFGDRFPLRYFVEEYGLDYYAAFPGCSSESEPSAATIAFLIDKAKEENISTIFNIEFSNHRISDSIAEATGSETALFHTCHNVSKEEMDAGEDYISLMTQNLERLKGAMK